jgi:hypothetical protein
VHETTVRFTDDLWAQVQRASRRDGTSAAQYVRDATLARVAVETHVIPLRHEVAAAVRRLDGRVRRIEEALQRNFGTPLHEERGGGRS